MAIEMIPEWMAGLEEEDLAFMKKFVLASGSLKEIAQQYGVTYPIQKIQISEEVSGDPYIALVKRLAVNEKIDFDTAKLLIQGYKKVKGE